MKRSEQGAVALLLMLVLLGIVASLATASALRAAAAPTREQVQARTLAEAAEALAGYARTRRCLLGKGTVADHLPCPDLGAAEGQAAGACGLPSTGRLPWRTLGILPLRDAAGECLWYERNAAGARVIAPGLAQGSQTRAASGAAPVCGGHYGAADYVEIAGNDVTLAVSAALLELPGGCP